MRFSLNDPLVKWLSDALPIIMSNDREFVDTHEDETIDANGIRFPANGIRLRTINDVKKDLWSE
jgi:hypothetical protein